jgi:hypothetical protein
MTNAAAGSRRGPVLSQVANRLRCLRRAGAYVLGCPDGACVRPVEG